MSLVTEIKRLIDDAEPEVSGLDVSNDWSPQPWFSRTAPAPRAVVSVPEFELSDFEDDGELIAA